MTGQNQFSHIFEPRQLLRAVLSGAAIAFALITLFFFGDGPPWDYGFRVYFPTITTTLGGAAGGLFYTLLAPLRRQSGALKVLGIVLGLVGCVIALWLGAVAGMAVTGDWD